MNETDTGMAHSNKIHITSTNHGTFHFQSASNMIKTTFIRYHRDGDREKKCSRPAQAQIEVQIYIENIKNENE